MGYEKREHPYEILIRLGPDGVEGAHVTRLVEHVVDGVVVSASTEPAQPVDLATVKKTLGTKTGDLTAKVDGLTIELEAARQNTESLAAEWAATLATLRDALATAASERDIALGRVAELEAEHAAARRDAEAMSEAAAERAGERDAARERIAELEEAWDLEMAHVVEIEAERDAARARLAELEETENAADALGEDPAAEDEPINEETVEDEPAKPD